MTGFDAFAIVVILASAAAGWVRGGTREIITLLSFVLAAFLALVALPLTAPAGRALIDPDWAGSITAAIVSFLIVYFGIRIFGSILSKQAQAHPTLGGIDRLVGIIVGAGRALVLLGAIHLVIVAAMPGERTPGWLSKATLRPVSAGAARAIQIVLPGIGRGADAISPVVDSSVRRGFSDDKALPPTQSGPTSRPAAPE
ncbi:CvpA family protein [Brevundimonas subvibrioides]|uniref:Colicin V production protein n=1 Tax=Brevundimonas subvibrioides (strain ATCC 15264 / DSM 4735 / LMG 14903 / NBRC 16000 / CB 81) TaxID=633149 RepID=D9QK82_BRESC|nr:CvpA family protein [Brevundimonas subvibrioides]ADL01667.1 Colicin V production protein [Brevundimonas subvibrioides ATCC 15264]